MKVIKDKGEDKIEVEGDLEEIEETFYEQTEDRKPSQEYQGRT